MLATHSYAICYERSQRSSIEINISPTPKILYKKSNEKESKVGGLLIKGGEGIAPSPASRASAGSGLLRQIEQAPEHLYALSASLSRSVPNGAPAQPLASF